MSKAYASVGTKIKGRAIKFDDENIRYVTRYDLEKNLLVSGWS